MLGTDQDLTPPASLTLLGPAEHYTSDNPSIVLKILTESPSPAQLRMLTEYAANHSPLSLEHYRKTNQPVQAILHHCRQLINLHAGS